jgi:hypothetical protein
LESGAFFPAGWRPRQQRVARGKIDNFWIDKSGRVVLNTDMDAANGIEDTMSEPLEIHWTGKSGTKDLFWIFRRPQSKRLFGQPGRL